MSYVSLNAPTCVYVHASNCLSIAKQIKNKKKIVEKNIKKYESQLLGEDTKKIEEEWQSAKELLSLSITEKYYKQLWEKTHQQIIQKEEYQHLVTQRKKNILKKM